jgi:hypothetical protein
MAKPSTLTSTDHARRAPPGTFSESATVPKKGACANCGELRPVMVVMNGGIGDKAPWDLCGRCWIEGRQPMKLGNV